MRRLTIACKGNSKSSATLRKLYLDGKYIGNGVFEENISIEIDDQSHVLDSVSPFGKESSLEIPAGSQLISVEQYILSDSSILSLQYTNDQINRLDLKKYKIKVHTPITNIDSSIIFCSIITFFYTIVGLMYYSDNLCSLSTLLVGIGFCLIGDYVIIISGNCVLSFPFVYVLISICGNSEDYSLSTKRIIYMALISILFFVANGLVFSNNIAELIGLY